MNLLGHAEDTRAQVRAVAARFPQAPLLALGASAGTGALVRYLGEEGPASPVAAAVAVCPGYDTGPGKAFDRFHPMLDTIILDSVKAFFLRPRNDGALAALPSGAVEALRASKSIGAFQRVAFELEGYGSLDAMYRGTNPMGVAHAIETPILCICAEDDPVCTITVRGG